MKNKTLLIEMIYRLPQMEKDTSFGKDIDDVHEVIFTERNKNQIEKILRKWASVKQPCVFGKLASKKIKGLDYHLSVINSESILSDEATLFHYLKDERLRFKQRAMKGEVSAHLIYFVSPYLAYARPCKEFMEIQKRICSLYIPECYPVMEDIIYTDSIPLQDAEGIKIYKSGINTFYSSAHGTRNHDRRIPGGFLISVNAPGHFMQLALKNGIYDSELHSLEYIKNMTKKSVGQGGISHPGKLSTTWHPEKKVDRYGCPLTQGQGAYYSGFYHTDVLIPGALTCDDRRLDKINDHDPMIFRWNVLFYVSLEKLSAENPYYGEFVGIPVDEEAAFFNPFAPRRYEDGPIYRKEEYL